jgi:hypothetical protein
MKGHRVKMSNLGGELTDKKIVDQIFNAIPTSLFRNTRYLRYNFASLTAAHVMSEVNAIYDELKLRGEIKSPATPYELKVLGNFTRD